MIFGTFLLEAYPRTHPKMGYVIGFYGFFTLGQQW